MTTILEELERISLSNSSIEQDEKIVRYVLLNAGFDKVTIVDGIVYLEGKGTLKNPPISLQQAAKSFVKQFKEVYKNEQRNV